MIKNNKPTFLVEMFKIKFFLYKLSISIAANRQFHSSRFGLSDFTLISLLDFEISFAGKNKFILK